MPTENEWLAKNVDLKLLVKRLEKFFREDGFTDVMVEEDPTAQWIEIQARKTDMMRTLLSSRKAIHIIIRGNPNKFEVTMTTGDFGKNIGLGMITGVGLIGVGLNAEFQHKLWNYVRESVDSLTNTFTPGLVNVQAAPGSVQQQAPATLSSPPPAVSTSPAHDVSGEKFCISCGTKIPKIARFCSSCGFTQN